MKNQIIETEDWKESCYYAKYKLATLQDMWVLREMEVQKFIVSGENDNCTTPSSSIMNKGSSKVNQLLTTIPTLHQQSTHVLDDTNYKVERKAFTNSIEEPETEF